MNVLRSGFAAAILTAVATSASAYSALYVLGDSLSDSGNVALAIGTNPTQVITGNGYIPSQPYASGTFSNANVWVNSFASAIGLTAFAAPSLAGGGDYAFGGARTASDGAGLPPSLLAQEALLVAAKGGTLAADALYVVAGGGNDARDALTAAAGSATPSTVIAGAAAAFAGNVGTIIDRLQAAGAVNIIVWDVPNIGLAPAVTSQGSGASFLGTQVSLAMNGALTARLASESGVSLFDIYGLQNRFVANPAAYGLTNVSDACGAVLGCNPQSYLFWDGIHPTSGGQALIAQGMIAVAVPEPETYALMLGGLAVVGWAARRRAA